MIKRATLAANSNFFWCLETNIGPHEVSTHTASFVKERQKTLKTIEILSLSIWRQVRETRFAAKIARTKSI